MSIPLASNAAAYEAAFRENEIDDSFLPNISAGNSSIDSNKGAGGRKATARRLA
jgi:hypothetical protein